MHSKQLLLGLTIVACAFSTPLMAAKKKGKRPPPVQEMVASEVGPYSLQAPKGWQCIDDKSGLPATVELVYVGAGKGKFTPSLNLATEETDMGQKEYVSLAKRYHESQADSRCYHLGSLEMKAGSADLLQIDRMSQWGEVRFLQASLVVGGKAHVLTATCLLEEYPNLYPLFMQMIQSFTINQGAHE